MNKVSLPLNSPDATNLNLLFLKAGETFQVCKRVSGLRGELPHLEFWLSTQSERERAEQEKAQDETTPPIPPPVSIERAEARRMVRIEFRRERQFLGSMDALDELIEAGWGDVPRERIPDNWRSQPRPQRKFIEPRGARKPARLAEEAARMRERYRKQRHG